MSKYLDGMGNDRTHYVHSLEEIRNQTEEMNVVIETLKAQNKALKAENTRLKKRKEESL